MINKYDRAVPKDWSWQTAVPQLPQLNFEAFDKLLAQQQQQFDSLTSTKQLVPNALQTEEDLALQKQYKDLVNSGSDSVTQAFIKSPSAGNMAYKNYINDIKKAWQPGGTADILDKRYKGFYEGKKAIDDYYKDETNPAFKQYAYDQLTKQVQAGPKYNPETGEYQVVNTPELFKNPDLRKKILETIKEIDESGTTQFLGDTNKDWWIQKIKTAGRDEDRIKLATQALMAQPEFENQLKVEQWYQNRNGAGQQKVDQFTKEQTKQLSTLEETAKAAGTSKDPKEVKAWQEMLVEQGYDVSPDGDFGSKTKTATEDFLSKQKTTLDANLANPDLESIVSKRALEKSYIDYARGFVNKKVDKELIFNRQKEVLLKDQRDRQKIGAMLQLNDRLAPVVDPDILVTPQPAINLTSTFDLLRETKANKESFEKGASKTLTQNPNSIFNGWTMANVAEAQRLYNDVPTTLNGKQLSEAERAQIFNQKLKENSTFEFTPEQVQNLYNGIKTDTGVNSTFEQIAAMDQSTKMLEDHTNQISTIYTSTPEGKKAIDGLRFQAPAKYRNLSNEELANKALTNPAEFKIDVSSSPEFPTYKNPAEDYKATMESDVKKHQRAGIDYKTDNAWGIHAGDKDKFLRPTYDNINAAINGQVEGSFASEGMSGLVFRNMKGEEVDAKPVFKDGYVTVGADGKPVYRAFGMSPKSNGKSEMVSTEITLNQGNPITMKLERELKKELAQNAATKNWSDVEAISKVLSSFDTKNMVTSAQEQQTPLKNLTPQALVIQDRDGEFTTTAKLGFKTRKIATKEYGGVKYHTYVGQDLSGNKVFFNTADRVDESGNPTGQQVVLPLRNGKRYTSDVAEINVQNMADEIISTTPVERDVKKIPEGVVRAITNFE